MLGAGKDSGKGPKEAGMEQPEENQIVTSGSQGNRLREQRDNEALRVSLGFIIEVGKSLVAFGLLANGRNRFHVTAG